MIAGIGAPDDIGGQAAFGLETRKSLERRGSEHPSEVPDHRFDHQLASHANANWKLASTASRRRPALRRASPFSGARFFSSSPAVSNAAPGTAPSSPLLLLPPFPPHPPFP